MPRPIHKLKALSVERLRREGRYSDGGGLYLSIKNGGRSWLFLYRSGDKRRELGLGPVSVVSLEAARAKATEARRMLIDGKDPLATKREAEAAARKIKTFGQYTTAFLKSTLKAFKNEKHRDQWRATLMTYAKPIWDKPLPAITTADVFAILQPIWHDKHETARRVRGRIERILSAAKAAGLRTGDNPAAWDDNLKPLLHKPKGVKKHFSALPYADAPAFMTALHTRESVSARALEFAILCASRTGEVIFAKWAEIDIPNKVWTIPAARMKMKREHRVPLTARAIEILQAMNPGEPDLFVFPGARRGQPLSDMALLECVRQIRKGVTTHGMRSTFSTWRAERTTFPKELAEFALAHNGGEGGIRTPDTVARMPHFECGAFNHSATSPQNRGWA